MFSTPTNYYYSFPKFHEQNNGLGNGLTESEKNNQATLVNANITTTEAAADAKAKVIEAISDDKNDQFLSEEEKAKKKATETAEAQNNIAVVDKEWTKLIKEYQKLFNNGANEQEKSKYKDEISNIDIGISDVKYHTTSNATKAANAIVLENKIEDAGKKLENIRKQTTTKIKKENEKSIAEDKNKEAKINTFIDMKNNPFYNSKNIVFDNEDDEVAV